MSLHLCNFEIQLQNYINHVVVHIFRDVFLCPVPLIPVLLSFLPLSPLGTFLFGRRWTLQDGQGISKGTVERPMSRYMLHLIALRDTDLYLCPLQLFQAADEVVCCEWMDLP